MPEGSASEQEDRARGNKTAAAKKFFFIYKTSVISGLHNDKRE